MSRTDIALRRLPSGRHQLSRTDVAASQRRRLLEAVVTIVGEKGWPATRIADVVAAAEVSRQTFYEQFSALDACFAEALKVGIGELLGQLDRDAWQNPISGRPGLAVRLRAFFDGYVAALASYPGLPQAVHVETLRSTDAVRDVRSQVIAQLSERIARAYAASQKSATNLPSLPEAYFRTLTGGLDELMRELIRNEGVEQALARYAAAATEIVVLALRPSGRATEDLSPAQW